MGSRSHHGCARCKRRRQKCTETRPSCKRCLDAAVPCYYLTVLKWDGRVPRDKQPSRSKCMNLAESRFDPDNVPSTDPTPQSGHYVPPEQSHTAPVWICQSPMHGLSLLDRLASSQKLLLHHFVTHSSMISSHSYLRERMCEQVSVALEIPSLLDATMALAALHRMSLLDDPSDGFTPEPVVSDLINRSLRNLRREIETHAPNINHLHTIRTLCVCEIYSGKADCAWRVHVNGAKAVLTSSASQKEQYLWHQADWLSLRWYESIQSLGALTENFLRAKRTDHLAQDHDWLLQPDSDSYSFDLYTGYSSDLNMVFRDIGRSIKDAGSGGQWNEQTSPKSLRDKAYSLEVTVRDMISRDATEGLRFPLDISLSEHEAEHFAVCNEAYQYSALIHILRKLQKRPASSSEVQACVRSILDAVCTILPVSTLSPWVLLTTPIFVAG